MSAMMSIQQCDDTFINLPMHEGQTSLGTLWVNRSQKSEQNRSKHVLNWAHAIKVLALCNTGELCTKHLTVRIGLSYDQGQHTVFVAHLTQLLALTVKLRISLTWICFTFLLEGFVILSVSVCQMCTCTYLDMDRQSLTRDKAILPMRYKYKKGIMATKAHFSNISFKCHFTLRKDKTNEISAKSLKTRHITPLNLFVRYRGDTLRYFLPTSKSYSHYQ